MVGGDFLGWGEAGGGEHIWGKGSQRNTEIGLARMGEYNGGKVKKYIDSQRSVPHLQPTTQ